MTRLAPALILVAALAACSGPTPTSTPAIKAAADKMRRVHEDCEARYHRGELKTLGAAERCADPRVIAVYADAGYPYMDLIRFAEEARVAGAEKVDDGKISEDEYDRQRLILRDRLAEEIRRRNDAASTQKPDAAAPRHGKEIDAATRAKLTQGLSAFNASAP